jgi:hypothetical protein
MMSSKVGIAVPLFMAFSLSPAAESGNLWPPRQFDQGVVAEWNAMLVSALPVSAGTSVPRYYALMHIAMADAISSIERKTPAIYSRVPAAHHASSDAAAAQAAHDVLVALLPERKLEFDLELKQRLATINPERGLQGVAVGRAIAQRTLQWAAKQSALS